MPQDREPILYCAPAPTAEAATLPRQVWPQHCHVAPASAKPSMSAAEPGTTVAALHASVATPALPAGIDSRPPAPQSIVQGGALPGLPGALWVPALPAAAARQLQDKFPSSCRSSTRLAEFVTGHVTASPQHRGFSFRLPPPGEASAVSFSEASGSAFAPYVTQVLGTLLCASPTAACTALQGQAPRLRWKVSRSLAAVLIAAINDPAPLQPQMDEMPAAEVLPLDAVQRAGRAEDAGFGPDAARAAETNEESSADVNSEESLERSTVSALSTAGQRVAAALNPSNGVSAAQACPTDAEGEAHSPEQSVLNPASHGGVSPHTQAFISLSKALSLWPAPVSGGDTCAARTESPAESLENSTTAGPRLGQCEGSDRLHTLSTEVLSTNALRRFRGMVPHSPAATLCSALTAAEGSAAGIMAQVSFMKRGRHSITREHISVAMLMQGGYLDMPIQIASQKLGMGVSVLKRICRGLGLARWPFRKRQSITHAITKTQQYLEEGRQEAVVLALEARLGGITGARNEDLDDAAKQYRQSIFKLNHKIKKIQSCARTRHTVAIPPSAAQRLAFLLLSNQSPTDVGESTVAAPRQLADGTSPPEPTLCSLCC